MRPPRDRHGTVLIIVVVVVMLLSLIAYKYLLAMQTEHMATAMSGDRLSAHQSAQSAHALLKVLLQMSRSERDRLGGLQDNPALFAGNTQVLRGTTGPQLTQPTTEERFLGLIAYPQERRLEYSESQTAAAPTAATPPDGLLFPPTRYGAINESQKLHLGKLLEWEAASEGAGVASLMAIPGMDQSTAEALMDWLDADDETRDQGAESNFYATLSRPLAPRNGLPFELEELLFVRGVTPYRLYGTITQLPLDGVGLGMQGAATNGSTTMVDEDFGNRSVSAATTSSDTSTTDLGFGMSNQSRPWAEWLTIYSAERNESYTGQRRIFLNADDLQQLHQSLSSRLSPSWADFIVLYRQFGPSPSNAAGTNPPTESVKMDFETPAKFVVESLVDVIGSSVSVPSDEEGRQTALVPSPAQTDALATTDLEQVLDQLTIIAEERIVGLININEAPAEVLATLPALSRETVDRIVAARQSNLETESMHVHPIWLLANDLVDLETMRALLPDVTCGGDVYRAQVWGRAQPNSAMVRFESVLDAASKPCRPVYFRERDVQNHQLKILSDVEFASLGLTLPELHAADADPSFSPSH